MKFVKTNTALGPHLFLRGDDTIGKSIDIYGEWAQNEIRFMLEFIRPGATVLDVGANIGVHAMEFSQKVGLLGQVHAFEPQTDALASGILTAAEQGRENITFSGFGLASKLGLGYLLAGASTENNFGARKTGLNLGIDQSELGRAPLVRLDDLNFDQVDFIKVDIEGSEISFLKGSKRTIKKFKPVIFLEANDHIAAKSLFTWAKKNSYKHQSILCLAFNPQNFAQNQENIFGQAAERMVVMIHKSRNAELKKLEDLFADTKYSDRIKKEDLEL